MHSRRIKLFTCLALSLMATAAMACQVPVFRFALERWTADKYEIVVIHDGPLTPEARSHIERLQSPEIRQFANFDVHVAEASKLRDERLIELWRECEVSDRPLMVILYPRTAMEVPDRLLRAAPLTQQHVDDLVTSPVRREIANRLSAGQSAIWIFVPSGQADKDAAARKMLDSQIASNRKRLTLPTAEELEIEPQVLEANRLPLKIDFSVVSLDRNDPREASCSVRWARASPISPASEPWAFPVFGRGRVLYALVGKGIMPETIDTACAFMVGPCSCQVKNQNPGFDLLLSHDWESVTAGSMISDALPEETATPKLLTIPPGR